MSGYDSTQLTSAGAALLFCAGAAVLATASFVGCFTAVTYVIERATRSIGLT